MPQMMPINWLMIFIMCLMSLFIMMILMNSFLLYIKKKMFMMQMMMKMNLMKNENDYDKQSIWNI